MNSCQIPIIKKEIKAGRPGATIHRGRGSGNRRSRWRRGTPYSGGRDSTSGVSSHVRLSFSIMGNTEMISVNWNSAVVILKSLWSKSQLSVSNPLQETEVYSQEMIHLENR